MLIFQVNYAVTKIRGICNIQILKHTYAKFQENLYDNYILITLSLVIDNINENTSFYTFPYKLTIFLNPQFLMLCINDKFLKLCTNDKKRHSYIKAWTMKGK